MKVLLVSTFDAGGAGIACLRLHQALLEIGVDSKLLILRSFSGEKRNIIEYRNIGSLLKKLLFKIFNKFYFLYKSKILLFGKIKAGLEAFSLPGILCGPVDLSIFAEADVINLHWVNNFLDLEYLFKRYKNKPIVWTLHDMNPFTGGCHYSSGCHLFEDRCQICPQLKGTLRPRITNKLVARKYESLNGANLSVVSPSTWINKVSKKSFLFNDFPHHIIPNGLDKDALKSILQEEARKKLNLHKESKIILFVADSIDNQRKGVNILMDALKILSLRKDLDFCSVGSGGLPSSPPPPHAIGEAFAGKNFIRIQCCRSCYSTFH